MWIQVYVWQTNQPVNVSQQNMLPYLGFAPYIRYFHGKK